MKSNSILHYAFRAQDTEKVAAFYADVFEGDYFLHPVMAGLGILMVKLFSPHAVFHGLLEFWPWDIEWDGATASFRRVPLACAPITYGHLALKFDKPQSDITAELDRRGIPWRMEPRGPDFLIPTIQDPEGNMIELFCNVDHMPLPPEAMVPRAQAPAAIAHLKRLLAEKTVSLPPDALIPLM